MNYVCISHRPRLQMNNARDNIVSIYDRPKQYTIKCNIDNLYLVYQNMKPTTLCVVVLHLNAVLFNNRTESLCLPNDV